MACCVSIELKDGIEAISKLWGNKVDGNNFVYFRLKLEN